MATQLGAVDYTTKIPNNVNLADDQRVLKALEQWHPGYIDWWMTMGPDGFQTSDVYLRTAISIDPKGWAKFDYVKMPEYRWGILLAPQDEQRQVNFGAPVEQLHQLRIADNEIKRRLAIGPTFHPLKADAGIDNLAIGLTHFCPGLAREYEAQLPAQCGGWRRNDFCHGKGQRDQAFSHAWLNRRRHSCRRLCNVRIDSSLRL